MEHTEETTPGEVRSSEGLGSAGDYEPGDISEDLFWRLHTLSKALESSGRIDEHENPGAYAAVLDAMNFVRSPTTPVTMKLAAVASLAHSGGLVGMSVADALIAIRRLTADHWDASGSEIDHRARVRKAVLMAAA